jgi:hypothetical protein
MLTVVVEHVSSLLTPGCQNEVLRLDIRKILYTSFQCESVLTVCDILQLIINHVNMC